MTIAIKDANGNVQNIQTASGNGASATPFLNTTDVSSVGGVIGPQVKANSLSTTLATDDPVSLVAGTTTGAAVITDAAGTLQQYLRGLVKLWSAGLQVVDSAGINKLSVNTSGQAAVLSSGYTATPTASFTRPANTTAYSIGQVVADSTTAATVRQFTCGRTNGNTGVIVGCQITDSAKQSTLPQFNLWLFSASPTVQNDGAAFAPSATDLTNLVTVINLFLFTGASANGVLEATELNRPFTCAVSDTKLYGVLVAANAYTPVSAEVFNITLTVLRD